MACRGTVLLYVLSTEYTVWTEFAWEREESAREEGSREQPVSKRALTLSLSLSLSLSACLAVLSRKEEPWGTEHRGSSSTQRIPDLEAGC